MATDKPVQSEGLGRTWSKSGDAIDPDSLLPDKVETQGWVANEKPFNQFANWILKFVSQFCNYINEQGIARWDAITEYQIGAYVKGTDNNLYRSLVNTNVGNNPVSSPTQWEIYGVIPSLTSDDISNEAAVSGATVTDALNELNDTDGIDDKAFSSDYTTTPPDRTLTRGLYALKLVSTRNIYVDTNDTLIPTGNVLHEIGRVSVPLDDFTTEFPVHRYYEFEAMIYTEGTNDTQFFVNIETFLNNTSSEVFDEVTLTSIYRTDDSPRPPRLVMNNNSQQSSDNQVGFSDSAYQFGSSTHPGAAKLNGTFVLDDNLLDVNDNLELRIFASVTDTGFTASVLGRSWFSIRPIYDYNPTTTEFT